MIDIGWSEMAVVALIALLILGPKELPQAMRMVARWVKKLRGMTRDVQSGFDQMIRDAELEDAKKAVQGVSTGSLNKTISDTIDPTGAVGESIGSLEKEARTSEREAKDNLSQSGESEGDNSNQSSGDQSSSDQSSTGNSEVSSSGVIETPLNIAPASSLRPPEESRSTDDGGSAATESSSNKKEELDEKPHS